MARRYHCTVVPPSLDFFVGGRRTLFYLQDPQPDPCPPTKSHNETRCPSPPLPSTANSSLSRPIATGKIAASPQIAFVRLRFNARYLTSGVHWALAAVHASSTSSTSSCTPTTSHTLSLSSPTQNPSTLPPQPWLSVPPTSVSRPLSSTSLARYVAGTPTFLAHSPFYPPPLPPRPPQMRFC